MSGNLTVVDWALCGIAALAVFIALYTHAEGNRVTAMLYAYEDIRRDMTGCPRHQVAWRAFKIVMGW